MRSVLFCAWLFCMGLVISYAIRHCQSWRPDRLPVELLTAALFSTIGVVILVVISRSFHKEICDEEKKIPGSCSCKCSSGADPSEASSHDAAGGSLPGAIRCSDVCLCDLGSQQDQEALQTERRITLSHAEIHGALGRHIMEMCSGMIPTRLSVYYAPPDGEPVARGGELRAEVTLREE